MPSAPEPSEELLGIDEFASAIAPLVDAAPFAVAVSGGADSTCLLVLAAEWCRSARRAPPVAVTVDHGLRDGSAHEAQTVASWSRKLGIAHATLRWRSKKPDSNVQSEARFARYTLIGQWMRSQSLSRLLTAHNKNDQAETLLMRIARGSGLEGMSGIAESASFPVREFWDLTVARPLLNVSHERLVATLTAKGHPWFEDPSNRDDKFLRARIRSLQPQLDSVGLTIGRLAAAADNLRSTNEFVHAEALELLQRTAEFTEEGYALAKAGTLEAAHPELAHRALNAVLKAVGGAVYAPEYGQMRQLLQWLLNASAREQGRTLGGCRMAKKAGGIVLFAREEAGALSAEHVVLSPGEEGIWDNRFRVELKTGKGPVTVRALGSDGLASLGGHLKLPPVEPHLVARTLPSAWHAGHPVSVPHLGFHQDFKLNVQFLGLGQPKTD